MGTQTVTPKYLNMPKPGKSYGSIKLANGNKMVGRAEVLGMMQPGSTYTVETETQRWGDGDVEVIKQATLANGAAPAAGAADPYEKRPTPTIDAERMFVAGALNALLPKIFERDNGLTPSKTVDLVNLLRGVWAETFGRPQA